MFDPSFPPHPSRLTGRWTAREEHRRYTPIHRRGCGRQVLTSYSWSLVCSLWRRELEDEEESSELRSRPSTTKDERSRPNNTNGRHLSRTSRRNLYLYRSEQIALKKWRWAWTTEEQDRARRSAWNYRFARQTSSSPIRCGLRSMMSHDSRTYLYRSRICESPILPPNCLLSLVQNRWSSDHTMS